MGKLKWYYILGIFIGIIAVAAIVYWLVRTTDLLSRLSCSPAEELPDTE